LVDNSAKNRIKESFTMSKFLRQLGNASHSVRSVRSVKLLLILLLLLLVGVQCAEACPGCKDALSENDPQHARMVRGYFWSILFMMAMPFTIAGTFGTFFYLEVRRKRSAEQIKDVSE
tara:strand:- start:956 stop:1309 length:354 start_codon:yes stop_codon:yes gene_type:complete